MISADVRECATDVVKDVLLKFVTHPRNPQSQENCADSDMKEIECIVGGGLDGVVSSARSSPPRGISPASVERSDLDLRTDILGGSSANPIAPFPAGVDAAPVSYRAAH